MLSTAVIPRPWFDSAQPAETASGPFPWTLMRLFECVRFVWQQKAKIERFVDRLTFEKQFHYTYSSFIILASKPILFCKITIDVPRLEASTVCVGKWVWTWVEDRKSTAPPFGTKRPQNSTCWSRRPRALVLAAVDLEYIDQPCQQVFSVCQITTFYHPWATSYTVSACDITPLDWVIMRVWKSRQRALWESWNCPHNHNGASCV